MKREPIFDIAKAIVMFMVVHGHLTGNFIVASGCGRIYSCFNIGIAMPLFFILSGFFSSRTIHLSDGKTFARPILLVWPLFSFGVVFGIFLFAYGELSFFKLLSYPLVRLCCGGWFLVTLAKIYFVFAIVWRILNQNLYRYIAIAIVYIVLFFAAEIKTPGVDVLQLANVLHMFPYFAFGMLVLSKYDLYRQWLIAIPCGIFFLGVVFFEGDIQRNGMGFYWVSTDWRDVVSNRHLFICFWARTTVGIAGVVFLLWVLKNLLLFMPKLAILSVLGTTTLGVYVMHEWPLIQIHKYLLFDTLPAQWEWILTCVLFLICHYLTIAIRRSSNAQMVFFGDERWLSGVIRKWVIKNR